MKNTNPTKTYEKLMSSGSLSSSTSVNQVTERRDLTTTNGTYPWSSATHEFRNDYSSVHDGRKIDFSNIESLIL